MSNFSVIFNSMLRNPRENVVSLAAMNNSQSAPLFNFSNSISGDCFLRTASKASVSGVQTTEEESIVKNESAKGDPRLAQEIRRMAVVVKDEDVEHLTPLAQQHLIDIIKFANKNGYQVRVNTAYRSYKRQSEMYRKNPNATSPDQSHHVLGDAYDLRFYNKRGVAPASFYNKVGKYAQNELGMRWGGTSLPPHYEPWHFDHGKDKTDCYKL